MQKKIFVLLTFLVLFSCSSDDDGPGIDLDLLYGQWFRVGLCQSQNSLLLNSDGTYVQISSGASDCNDTGPDTTRTEGTYRVQNRIYTTTVTSSEVINEGTNLSIQDFEIFEPVTEIIELTETRLRMQVSIIGENNVVEILSQPTYER